MRAREGFRRRGGIQSVWDFADPDHAARIPFQRDGHHGWLPAQEWQQYLEANGLGVSLRTAWNWVAVARREGRLSARTPSRAGVTPDVRLRALRLGNGRSAPYGPFGGLPGRVRGDRGKDFLSGAVAIALGAPTGRAPWRL